MGTGGVCVCVWSPPPLSEIKDYRGLKMVRRAERAHFCVFCEAGILWDDVSAWERLVLRLKRMHWCCDSACSGTGTHSLVSASHSRLTGSSSKPLKRSRNKHFTLTALFSIYYEFIAHYNVFFSADIMFLRLSICYWCRNNYWLS